MSSKLRGARGGLNHLLVCHHFLCFQKGKIKKIYPSIRKGCTKINTYINPVEGPRSRLLQTIQLKQFWKLCVRFYFLIQLTKYAL